MMMCISLQHRRRLLLFVLLPIVFLLYYYLTINNSNNPNDSNTISNTTSVLSTIQYQPTLRTNRYMMMIPKLNDSTTDGTTTIFARSLQQQQDDRIDNSNNNNDTDNNNDDIKIHIMIIFNIIGSIVCIIMFAIISGLFLGFLTLDTIDLQIIQRSSLDMDERIYATTLIPLVKRRHQILVTLELMSALVYETLPIFLDALVPSWVAVLLSVTIVMVFGEIIPSGIFMGPNQLYLGYHMVPLMSFLLWIFQPLATPLVKLLDYLTDTDEDDTDPYSRDELSALVRIQHEAELDTTMQHLHPSLRAVRTTGPQQRLSRSMKKDRRKDQTWRALKEELLERVQEKQESNPKSFPPDFDDVDEIADRLSLQLHPREVSMVEGALQMKTVHAMDIYTPLSSCYCVPDNLILDKMTITTIYGHGFSRVPVYRTNLDDVEDNSLILGFLVTRQLMVIDWDDNREILTLPLQRPTCVSPRMNLIDLFEVLQKDGRMLTFVCARPDLANKALKSELPIPVEAGLMGIITLVDIMESILQDRIYDEGDIRDRDRAVATLTRWAATIVQKFMRRSAALKKLERQRTSSITKDENGFIQYNYNNTNNTHYNVNHDNGDDSSSNNNTYNNESPSSLNNHDRYDQQMTERWINTNNTTTTSSLTTRSNDYETDKHVEDEAKVPLLGSTTTRTTISSSTSTSLLGPPLVRIKKPKLQQPQNKNRLFFK